jgi:hypothetical protein
MLESAGISINSENSEGEKPQFISELEMPNTKVRVRGTITVSEITEESQAAIKEQAKKEI